MPDNPDLPPGQWNYPKHMTGSTHEYVIPEAPMALQLRIANLLAVAAMPAPYVRGDVIRNKAWTEALHLLGLTADE